MKGYVRLEKDSGTADSYGDQSAEMISEKEVLAFHLSAAQSNIEDYYHIELTGNGRTIE